MAVYVFAKWQSAAFLDFCRSTIWRYFCFRDVVSKPNFVRICAIATELWPFKWTFKLVAAAILDFSKVKFDVSHRMSRAARIYLHTKFGEDTSTGDRVMAIYVFSKWRSAAILDFYGSKIWRYFCFCDVGFSLWTKFCANMCNLDRVMAV